MMRLILHSIIQFSLISSLICAINAFSESPTIPPIPRVFLLADSIAANPSFQKKSLIKQIYAQDLSANSYIKISKKSRVKLSPNATGPFGAKILPGDVIRFCNVRVESSAYDSLEYEIEDQTNSIIRYGWPKYQASAKLTKIRKIPSDRHSKAVEVQDNQLIDIEADSMASIFQAIMKVNLALRSIIPIDSTNYTIRRTLIGDTAEDLPLSGLISYENKPEYSTEYVIRELRRKIHEESYVDFVYNPKSTDFVQGWKFILPQATPKHIDIGCDNFELIQGHSVGFIDYTAGGIYPVLTKYQPPKFNIQNIPTFPPRIGSITAAFMQLNFRNPTGVPTDCVYSASLVGGVDSSSSSTAKSGGFNIKVDIIVFRKRR